MSNWRCWFGHDWEKTKCLIGTVTLGPSLAEKMVSDTAAAVDMDCVVRVLECTHCGEKRAEREISGERITALPVELVEKMVHEAENRNG